MALFLLVVIEVGGVGLLRTALGPFGLVVETTILVFAGWCALSASRHSQVAIWLGIVGLPIALGINVLLDELLPWRMSLIAGVVGMGLLTAWWRRGRRSPAPATMAVSVA